MVEDVELRRKQARALQQQRRGQEEKAWGGGGTDAAGPGAVYQQHMLAGPTATLDAPPSAPSLLPAPAATAAALVLFTEEDRLLRSLLRRACPLVRRKGKILHELQARSLSSLV